MAAVRAAALSDRLPFLAVQRMRKRGEWTMTLTSGSERQSTEWRREQARGQVERGERRGCEWGSGQRAVEGVGLV